MTGPWIVSPGERRPAGSGRTVSLSEKHRAADPGGGVFRKAPDIVAWANGRAFAWIDDEITQADRTWVEAHHDGPALLSPVAPRHGLAAADFTALTAWAATLD